MFSWELSSDNKAHSSWEDNSPTSACAHTWEKEARGSSSRIRNLQSRDFPGNPVVKTPHFQCGVAGSVPGQRINILHEVAKIPKPITNNITNSIKTLKIIHIKKQNLFQKRNPKVALPSPISSWRQPGSCSFFNTWYVVIRTKGIPLEKTKLTMQPTGSKQNNSKENVWKRRNYGGGGWGFLKDLSQNVKRKICRASTLRLYGH